MSESYFNTTNFKTNNTLKKCERLYLENDISTLFKEGKRLNFDGLLILYRFTDGDTPSVLITVPKRVQPKANKRVHSKRIIRESYRKHKHILIDVLRENNCNIHFAIIVRNANRLDYLETESKIILTLQRLSEIVIKENKI